MHRMGIEALYRKPNTSKKHPGHKVYPYLLRGLQINRASQVWAMDITYIPMAKGWVYLTVVPDWFAISMDGKGCWRDNVFVERLWRSVKYEEVYLKAYASVSEARTSLGKYLSFYNCTRSHSTHAASTPEMVYFKSLPKLKKAA